MAGGEIMENNNDFELNYVAIGKRIREIRTKLGKKQEDFAAFVFPGQIKGQSYISDWENARYHISLDNLAAIARACNVSLDWLVTGNYFKPAGIENNRFTLREICAALSQAIFLCDGSITISKKDSGESVISLSFTSQSPDSKKKYLPKYLPKGIVIRFLAALSSAVSLDRSYGTLVTATDNLHAILEYDGETGQIEGMPNTAPARQVCEKALQLIPDLTPYAQHYLTIFEFQHDQYGRPVNPVPNSFQEHMKLLKEYGHDL